MVSIIMASERPRNITLSSSVCKWIFVFGPYCRSGRFNKSLLMSVLSNSFCWWLSLVEGTDSLLDWLFSLFSCFLTAIPFVTVPNSWFVIRLINIHRKLGVAHIKVLQYLYIFRGNEYQFCYILTHTNVTDVTHNRSK